MAMAPSTLIIFHTIPIQHNETLCFFSLFILYQHSSHHRLISLHTRYHTIIISNNKKNTSIHFTYSFIQTTYRKGTKTQLTTWSCRCQKCLHTKAHKKIACVYKRTISCATLTVAETLNIMTVTLCRRYIGILYMAHFSHTHTLNVRSLTFYTIFFFLHTTYTNSQCIRDREVEKERKRVFCMDHERRQWKNECQHNIRSEYICLALRTFFLLTSSLPSHDNVIQYQYHFTFSHQKQRYSLHTNDVFSHVRVSYHLCTYIYDDSCEKTHSR